jgi:lipid-A-disaccharide synthase
VDRLAVTLPFEEHWFRRRGVAAHHVGHPAVELFQPADRRQARRRLGLGQGPVLALLPGSRLNEVQRHLPVMRAALGLLPGGLRPVLATLPGELAQRCRRLAPELQQTSAAEALGAADLAACASGSATLELALAGVPGVVVYRLSAASYAVARRLVQVEHAALPNLLLGRRLLPELIQQQLTPAALARELRALSAPDRTAAVRRGLEQLRRRLGPAGAAERVAALALELMGQG